MAEAKSALVAGALAGLHVYCHNRSSPGLIVPAWHGGGQRLAVTRWSPSVPLAVQWPLCSEGPQDTMAMTVTPAIELFPGTSLRAALQSCPCLAPDQPTKPFATVHESLYGLCSGPLSLESGWPAGRLLPHTALQVHP